MWFDCRHIALRVMVSLLYLMEQTAILMQERAVNTH